MKTLPMSVNGYQEVGFTLNQPKTEFMLSGSHQRINNFQTTPSLLTTF